MHRCVFAKNETLFPTQWFTGNTPLLNCVSYILMSGLFYIDLDSTWSNIANCVSHKSSWNCDVTLNVCAQLSENTAMTFL